MSWIGEPGYWPDIEADAWRFYRLWLDIEAELFPSGIAVGRLIQMVERLPLYDGVLTARAQAEINRHRRPGADHQNHPGVEVIGSTGAELLSHPATAGLIDYVKV